MVGLGNVNNTSDKDKPLSDETKAMFETVAKAVDITISKKADKLDPIFTGNVQGITKTMVGPGNVNNTSDKDKPVSDATISELNLKADKLDPMTKKNLFPMPRKVRSA